MVWSDGQTGARRALDLQLLDDQAVEVLVGCQSDSDTLCLAAGRFSVEATWTDFSGNRGTAQAVTLTSDTGCFWFFEQDNVEAVVKVLDACAINGSFWVFAGGLTNVQVSLRVTDTLSGSLRTYDNPLSTPFQPIQDTAAFECAVSASKD